MNKFFLVLVFILSSAQVFAEGPCGKGKYVRRCFGGCGVPYKCRYVCSGPHNLKSQAQSTFTQVLEDNSDAPFDSVQGLLDNEEMEVKLETMGACH